MIEDWWLIAQPDDICYSYLYSNVLPCMLNREKTINVSNQKVALLQSLYVVVEKKRQRNCVKCQT